MSTTKLAKLFGVPVVPISWVGLAGELQRDWARAETVDGLRQIVLAERLLRE